MNNLNFTQSFNMIEPSFIDKFISVFLAILRKSCRPAGKAIERPQLKSRRHACPPTD